MKQRRNITLSIPVKLHNAVEALNLSPANKNHAYKFISRLLGTGSHKKNHFEFDEIPSSYFKKVFNSSYDGAFLKPLKQAGIVECNESYFPGTDNVRGECKKYRINPVLLDGEIGLVEYVDKKPALNEDDFIPINQTYFYSSNPLKPINRDVINSMKDIISNNKNLSSLPPLHICYRFFRKQLVVDDLASLQYNATTLEQAVSASVGAVSRHNILVNEEIEDNWLKLVIDRRNERKYKEISTKTVLDIARNLGLSLIQRKRDFLIDDVEGLLRERKQDVATSARLAIKNLQVGNFYVRRSRENARLNHNLTNISSDILEAIKIDNGLIELDLKNSQFAIHAHWLKEEGWLIHEDVRKYYNAAAAGELYELISKTIHVDRKRAKSTMLYMGFSKPGSTGKNTKLIRQRFPNVFQHIDQFKNEHEYKAFSIELQKREATLFIDNLYPNIKKEGLFCLTKHDSLLVRRKDAERVISIVQAYFKHLGFQGKLSNVD